MINLVGFYNSQYQKPEVKGQIFLVQDYLVPVNNSSDNLREVVQYIQLELFELMEGIMIEQDQLAFCLMTFYGYRSLTDRECKAYLDGELQVECKAYDIFYNWETINSDIKELRSKYGKLYLIEWLKRCVVSNYEE